LFGHQGNSFYIPNKRGVLRKFHFDRLAELNELSIAVNHLLIPVNQYLECLNFNLYLLIEIAFN
jgi:hypothetical protein